MGTGKFRGIIMPFIEVDPTTYKPLRTNNQVTPVDNMSNIDQESSASDENLLSRLLGGTTRGVARAGSAALGAPLDIATGVGSLLSKLLPDASEEDKQKSRTQMAESSRKLQEITGMGPAGKRQETEITDEPVFGTSEYLFEKAYKPAVESFLPKSFSKGEGSIDEFVDLLGDSVGALSSPFFGGIAGASKLLKSGEALKKGAQVAGGRYVGRKSGLPGGEAVGGLLGYSGPTILKNAKELPNTLRSINKKTYALRDKLASGISLKANNFESHLKKQAKDIASSKPDGWQKIKERYDAVLGQIKPIAKGSKSKNVNMSKILDQERNINQWLMNHQNADPSSIHWMSKLKGDLLSMVQEAGKDNPEFLKSYNTSKNQFLALNSSKLINNVLTGLSDPKQYFKNNLTPLFLLGTPYASSVLGIPKSVIFAGGLGYAGKDIAKFGRNIMKDPEFNKAVMSVADSALNGQSTQFIRNLKRADDVVSKHVNQPQETQRRRMDI